MHYDKKFVTPSFKAALAKVLIPEKEEEVQEMADGKPNAIDPNKDGDKMVYSKDGTKSAPKSTVDKYKKKLTGESEEVEETEVELTEEEIISALEEELSPHIEHLLSEGFSEDEVEHLILEMLAEEEAEAEEEVADERVEHDK